MKFNSTLVALLVLVLCTVLAHGSLLAVVSVGLAGVGMARAGILGLFHGHHHGHGHYGYGPSYHSYYAVPYVYRHHGYGHHYW